MSSDRFVTSGVAGGSQDRALNLALPRAASLTALFLLVVSLSGYDNLVAVDVRGDLALSLAGDGDVILDVAPCDYRVDSVHVHAGRESLGGGPNQRFGDLHAEQSLVGRFEVNLPFPGAAWRSR